MVNFLHRLLRRNLQRVNLPIEVDWESLKSSGFWKKEFLINEQFVFKTSFKNRALFVVKSQTSGDKPEEKVGTRGAIATLVAEKYTTFVDPFPEFTRQMCLGFFVA